MHQSPLSIFPQSLMLWLAMPVLAFWAPAGHVACSNLSGSETKTASPQNATVPMYYWSTFVGNPGGAGKVDGSWGLARFSKPAGAIVDADGNLYVADERNEAIRKITPDGKVTTLVEDAWEYKERRDRTDTGAYEEYPWTMGLAMDEAGNIFVAGAGVTNQIIKVTPAGEISVYAGADLPGYTNGPKETAQFRIPCGLTFDQEGNLLVADTYNHTIRKITPEGMVSTLAGVGRSRGHHNGPPAEARFRYPSDLAVASDGSIYVSDTGNGVIRKISADGMVTTWAGLSYWAGSRQKEPPVVVPLKRPRAITLDAQDNLHVTDTELNRIYKISPDGVFNEIGYFQQDLEGNPLERPYDRPRGLAMDADGTLFIADTGNEVIRKVGADQLVYTLAGLAAEQPTFAVGERSRTRVNPQDVATWSNGDVLIYNASPRGLIQVTPDGHSSIISQERFSGLATDSADNIYTFRSDYIPGVGNPYILHKVTPAMEWNPIAGGASDSEDIDGKGSQAGFTEGGSLNYGNDGNLYQGTYGSDVIRKITPEGVVTTIAGTPDHNGHVDGPAEQAKFSYPMEVTADSRGNVYVADSGNNTIRKISPDLTVSTLIDNNTGEEISLVDPGAIVCDALDNLYVTGDVFWVPTGNPVHRITRDGQVDLIGGSLTEMGNLDGLGSSSRLGHARRIALGEGGVIYVTDGKNDNVRMATPVNNEHPPVLSLERPDDPAFALSDSLDFGTSSGSMDEKSVDIILSNSGESNLAVGSIVITGQHPHDFSQSGAIPATLPPGEEARLTLTFRPIAPGPRSGILAIYSNDLTEDPHTIDLAGDGMVPEIDFYYGDIRLVPNEPPATPAHPQFFGRVHAGTPVSRTFTIQNNGSDNLEITRLEIMDSEQSAFEITNIAQITLPLILAPNASQPLVITFSPTTHGEIESILQITCNDGDESHSALPLAGFGLASEIRFRDFTSLTDRGNLEYNFGDVYLGETVSKPVHFVNVGNSELSLNHISFSGAPQFSLDHTVIDSTLAPGEWAKTTADFTATEAGEFTAALQLSTNDPAVPTVTYKVKATVKTDYNTFIRFHFPRYGTYNRMVDTDGDGVINVAEYALFTNPKDAGSFPNVNVEIVEHEGELYMQASVSKAPELYHRVNIIPWICSGFGQPWCTGDEHLVVVENSDKILKVRDAHPVSAHAQRHFRFSITYTSGY